MAKYLKWVFNDKIRNSDKSFEVGKVIESSTWDPDNEDWSLRGGFNFTNEECALRWVARGDTLYEVIIPEDAEVREIKNDKTPGGIYLSNKIILDNPIPISDELLNEYYEKSHLPLPTYFECIGVLATRGYKDLTLKIIKDKVTIDNVDLAIEKLNAKNKPDREINYETFNAVKEVLEEIKSDILINLYIDKDSFEKTITNDNIINLTGQSGAGKSTYASKFINNDKYLVVDTDEILSDKRFEKATGINKELGEYFRSKYDKLPIAGDDFDLIYKEILDYCKKYNDKTIVIDSAQFHCIKDIKLLKGKIIILRTSISTCYERTIERYKKNFPNYTKEELEAFKKKKKSIFAWYKGSNEFIKKIENEL
ncbi:MAG: hypothetical protein IJS56_04470 [Bacilli bacterium]|nr:hypothetical protein [Bacilli bacterium]